ncbi:GAF domain-containing protein [Halovenus sp. HT40]|uniref:GAF domain-containing protein n=1 Tax=Halovenus sp. HT40 TaxID=3126691 RepID=UPI003FA5855D
MADTPEGVAESGIVAASNILDLSISTVFFESDGELEPVASSEDAEELFNEIEPLERDEAVAWEVYESGEPLHTTDVTQLDSIHNPDTPISSEMIVPLADHGVLLAGRRQEAAFDESDFTLAQILGKNIGTALDRVAREQELRAQE